VPAKDLTDKATLIDGRPPVQRPGPRRTELRGFLRARRAELSPEDVGMAPGVRRRTPGLRREEVAMLAGVGVTWYTWLEQGRRINASAQVLDAVARTLQLDTAERWHLYRLAEATPVRSPSCTAAPEVVTELLHSMDPLPAVLINEQFDVIVSNKAHEDLFWDWHSLPCVHKNLLWCCVTEPLSRDRFLNYDEEVPYMVARLRAAYGSHLDDPDWCEDIRRLSDLCPEFAMLWERHEVAGPSVRPRHFRHPDVGELRLNATELEVAVSPGLRIIAYTPIDDRTRELLPRTRRHDAQVGYPGV
jgi:transcriptional regulator with XRE-family HTH domain